MGTGLVKLGGVAVREGFEQLTKRLAKEQPNVAGKILGGLDNATKNFLSKEIADYPPSAIELKDIMRNHPEDFPIWIRKLKGEKVNQQTADSIQNIVNQNKPKPEVKFPSKYDVQGNEGRAFVRNNLSNWLKEQQGLVESGQIKKIDRSQFAKEGIFIDGEERGISGITEHIKSGYKSQIKLDALGPAQARAKQADPANVPKLKEWFETGNQRFVESGGKEGIHPDLSFEEYRSSVLRGANKADDVTSELAKELGIKLDKEHMRSLGDLGSNDPRSQVPGSAKYNRSMGKIDSFNREVMEILGLPSSGDEAAAKAITGTGPRSTDARNVHRQKGWWQSATDWVGSDGGTLDDMSQWNPGDLLTDVDKLRIQQNPGKNQAKLAMQILAERQIVHAYVKAGLGKTADEKALLGRILKHIDAKTALKKALAEAKESMPESQLEDLARKYPNERREQLMERANKSLSSRITQSKYGMNEPKLTKLESEATGKIE